MENEKVVQFPSKVSLLNRKQLSVTGVKDVKSFDVEEVLLDTDCGRLSIQGEKLHINRLSLEKGEVEVDGYITSLIYKGLEPSLGQKTNSLFGRLFQ